ncbi:MAG: hypothetical protein AAF639_33495 [Chloroflexota bacterium]
MAKKQKSFESKLGSWKDQASLTRSQSTDESDTKSANRTEYVVARSLMTRITEAAQKNGMSESEVVGHLLTWALDQVDAGVHSFPEKS